MYTLYNKKVISFNLPAVKTCPGAGYCKSFCFAKVGCFQFRNVQENYLENYLETLESNFASNFMNKINLINFDILRFHDSGDIYNQSYLEKIKKIAAKIPNKIVYMYTKSLHLNFDHVPSNMHVVQSLGGKYDKLVNLKRSHSRVFPSEISAIAAGYKLSPDGSDILAIDGTVKIGLVYHGTKKLNNNQINYLNKEA